MTIIYLTVLLWSSSTTSLYTHPTAIAACLSSISDRSNYNANSTAFKAQIDKTGRILWMRPLNCEIKL